MTRAALLLVLLAGSCATERDATRKIAEAASATTSTLAVARATIQRFVPAADPLAKLPPPTQAKAQLTEAIIVTVSDGIAALLAYMAYRQARSVPDAGVAVDAGVP